jgi:hypothetical protein
MKRLIASAAHLSVVLPADFPVVLLDFVVNEPS